MKYVGPSPGTIAGLARALVGDENFDTGTAVVEEGLQTLRSNLECARQGLFEVKAEMARRKADGTLHEFKNPKTCQSWLEYLTGLLMKYTKAADQGVRCARTIIYTPVFDKLATAALAATGKDIMERRAMERRARTMGDGDQEAAGLVWRDETVPGTCQLKWE